MGQPHPNRRHRRVVRLRNTVVALGPTDLDLVQEIDPVLDEVADAPLGTRTG